MTVLKLINLLQVRHHLCCSWSSSHMNQLLSCYASIISHPYVTKTLRKSTSYPPEKLHVVKLPYYKKKITATKKAKFVLKGENLHKHKIQNIFKRHSDPRGKNNGSDSAFTVHHRPGCGGRFMGFSNFDFSGIWFV